MKVAAFCDRDTAMGLRLAGVKIVYVIDKNNKVKQWNEILQNQEIEVLFITERIAEELKQYIKDYRLRNNIPIIVEIPDKKGRIPDHVDFVNHLIKKAVGIEVNK